MIKYDELNNAYVVSFSKRNKKTRQAVSARRIGIKTKAEANRVFRELVIQVEDKIREKTLPTWKTLVADFLQAGRNSGLTEKTLHDYKCNLQGHTFDLWGDRLIDCINTDEIRILITSRLAEKSTSHRKNILKVIRLSFQYAVDKGLLLTNPTPALKMQVGTKLKAVLTEAEVRVLLERAKQANWEWYPHYVLAVYTGMRNGELFALTWDKVNFETRQIKVDTAWNNKDGFKSTKSGNDRIVEIAPPLIPVLQTLKLQSGPSPFVLPRIDKWEKGEQARDLRMFLLGIGLPVVRFHDLRATWATLLLSKDVPMLKVMVMGGWKDLKTMQIYMRKAGVDIRGATDCLDLHNPSLEACAVLDFDVNRKR